MVLKVSSSIEIPESERNTFWVSHILSQLTRNQRRFDDPDKYDTLFFYEVRNGVIKIPRLFKIKNSDIQLDRQVTDGEKINIEFKSK